MARKSPAMIRQPDTQALIAAIEEIKTTLRSQAQSGLRGFDCTPESLQKLAAWERLRDNASETLETIRRDLGDCRRCGLSATRQRIVFGRGNPHPRLVFVGEGPGREEDQTGEPFVGAAGQLLTRIIQAMGLSREAVYICNIVKCRPPGNRNPAPEEIHTCAPFLKRQLAALKPELACALGTFAARTLLGTDTAVSRLRGRFHGYHGIRLLPTYHPAYLLRNPEKKREVWEDMQMLMRELGL